MFCAENEEVRFRAQRFDCRQEIEKGSETEREICRRCFENDEITIGGRYGMTEEGVYLALFEGDVWCACLGCGCKV